MGEIYGIATALLASRKTDTAAAAAWDDLMNSVRGGCREVIRSLKSEGQLNDRWTIDEATDLLSTMLSIAGWEQLTIERGWSVKKYVRVMQKGARQCFASEG